MCRHVKSFEKLFSIFRHVWESKADGKFAVSEDTWNEPLGRGTEIRLHLRDEAGEYLEESKLKVSHILITLEVKSSFISEYCLIVVVMIIFVYYRTW